jgi:hypothetical protein
LGSITIALWTNRFGGNRCRKSQEEARFSTHLEFVPSKGSPPPL